MVINYDIESLLAIVISIHIGIKAIVYNRREF